MTTNAKREMATVEFWIKLFIGPIIIVTGFLWAMNVSVERLSIRLDEVEQTQATELREISKVKDALVQIILNKDELDDIKADHEKDLVALKELLESVRVRVIKHADDLDTLDDRMDAAEFRINSFPGQPAN